MRSLLVMCALVGTTAGCGLFDGGDPPPTARRGIGESCSADDDCRIGLACSPEMGTCQPAGNVELGGACIFTGDCTDGLYCAADRTCSMSGEADEGGTCGSTADCLAGLTCELRGFYAECIQSGTGDTGTECTTGSDCVAGLSCLGLPGESQCGSGPAAPPGTVLPPAIPVWAGVECPPDATTSVSYFEVPRFDETDNDFYRLPFPNDVRRNANGSPDLRGHPTPETVLDVDIVDRYLRAAEDQQRGFSTNPVAYFRFSAQYDWDSIPGNIFLVDIDPDSPTFGSEQALAWLTTFGPISKYLCENWLGIRSAHGSPLRPDTTYAVLMTDGVAPTPEVGGTFATDADFDTLLGSSRPGDAVMGAAWDAYQPLRDWLPDSAEVLEGANLLNAAVFTTQPRTNVAGLRDAIHAGVLPAVSDLTECTAAATSPCDDGTVARSCEGAPSASFSEIHGRVSLPIFQQGTPPYTTPEDGGAVSFGADGTPQQARTEDVCFGLTVPTGTAPPEGWPLVIALHGTGGSFRTAIGGGLAEAMAGNQAATLAIDLPMHGERRGDTDESPDRLFFNFLNPGAAWGNNLQGSADILSLVRWAIEGGIDAAESPTGSDVAFDPARIAVFAHSQGANHSTISVPFESDIAGIILSGSGGDLTQSLLTKESPINIAAVLPFALLDANGEGKLATGDFHPVLALWQGYFDGVDGVNYGLLWGRDPVAGVPLKHVFMTYGIGDTYSTEATLIANARASGFPHVAPHALDLPLTEVMPPFSANYVVDDVMTTQALRSYMPTGGEDGHFVASRTDQGRADTRAFLREVLALQVPTLR